MILAIDPGTHRTGWALFDNEGSYEASGWVAAESEDTHRRILEMVRLLPYEVPRRKLARPGEHYIACELPFVGPNPKSALKLARLIGALEATIPCQGCSWLWITTRSARYALTDHGKAPKVKVKEFATAVAGKSKINEDEAMAIAIGKAAVAKVRDIKEAVK